MGHVVPTDPLILPELAVWTDPSWVPFCRQWVEGLVDCARLIAVGGPACGEVENLARHWGLTVDDDLRRMLTNYPAGYLLLATRQTPEPAALQAALDHDTTLLLLEPLAADLAEWALACRSRHSHLRKPLAPIYLPTFLQCPGWLHAADPLEALGQLRTLLFVSHGHPNQASLFMRLMDAWLTLSALTELPETLHAAWIPGAGPPQMPADLRLAEGSMQMHARMADGQGALVQVSDQAGVVSRQLLLLSTQAQLLVGEHDYRLHDLQGGLLDEHPPRGTPGSPPVLENALVSREDPWLRLCLAQARRLMSSASAAAASRSRDFSARALACCQAAWLSCRTGQPESPREMLRMHLPLEEI